MSHPQPGHDYSEQTKGESNKEYKGRRAKALKSKMNPTQKMTHGWLRDAGKEMDKNRRKGGESQLGHLKRLLK